MVDWILAHPWASITGGIALVSAMGAAMMWWHSIKKMRREERNANRESKIAACLSSIEKLDLNTPGGLRSVSPSPGEDPAIVKEAWERFVRKRIHGGKGRFNR